MRLLWEVGLAGWRGYASMHVLSSLLHVALPLKQPAAEAARCSARRSASSPPSGAVSSCCSSCLRHTQPAPAPIPVTLLPTAAGVDSIINCACAPSAVQDGRVVVHAKMDICPLPASGGKRNVFILQNEQHRAVS